jgi:hypothetical protein
MKSLQTNRSLRIQDLVKAGLTKAQANSQIDREHNDYVRRVFKSRSAYFRTTSNQPTATSQQPTAN